MRHFTRYILRESQTTQNVLWSRASMCLSVFVSVCLYVRLFAAVCPHCCTDPDVIWGSGRGCLLVVTVGRICNGWTGYVAMATLWKCVAEPCGNPPGPPHAARMPHTHTTHTGKTPLAGNKIDAPDACAVPFRPYCGGVATRTGNVSEYMLVLAVCLVLFGGPLRTFSENFVQIR